MQLFAYTTKTKEEILQEFNVNERTGLLSEEVEDRIKRYGLNEVNAKITRWWHILLRQFRSPFIYLLIGAALLSYILGEFTDGSIIILFLLINSALGFYQEFRSEKALQLLKQYVKSYTKVIRNGQEVAVRSEEIVPGDLVIFETGDKITADVRFIEAQNLILDESILTGESVSVHKNERTMEKEAKDYYQSDNLAFSGTTVVSGKGMGIVIATGLSTAFGHLAKLEADTKRISNFEKGINDFSNFILKLVIVTLCFVFIANVFIKGLNTSIVELLIFSIALAVSVIPEALPVVTTFSLTRGAINLAKQKVVVKRLSAIEDLGGIEVLCTDKTGTLTQNVLTVAEIAPNSSHDLLLFANYACSTLQQNKLEPFDIALWEKLSEVEKGLVQKVNRINELPFDPERKRNTVIIENAPVNELIVRGAPEVLMQLSKLSKGSISFFNNWIKEQGVKGRRVLAVGKKQIDKEQAKDPDLERFENGLEFLGIISFVDPIKQSAYAAAKQSKELGVRIVILTGDSKEVAGAVASQIGLCNSPQEVITAEEFEAMSPQKQSAVVNKYSVFARVSPEQKYSLVEKFQKKYQVGFLGEGINDAPALKMAGVSLVVEGASDIARESADIILLKRNLNVILDGIREGRKVFANTTKYIKATLASNFGNFYAVAVASLFIDYLPMLPIQILTLNLLSDFPMIAISTDNVEEEDIKTPRKYNVRDITFVSSILGMVSSVFDFIFFGIFYRIGAAVLQTNWFIGSILTELVFLFSIRAKGPFYKSRVPSRALIWLTSVAILITVILPYTNFGKLIFEFQPPKFSYLGLVFFIVFVYFICTETIKIYFYKTVSNLQKRKNVSI